MGAAITHESMPANRVRRRAVTCAVRLSISNRSAGTATTRLGAVQRRPAAGGRNANKPTTFLAFQRAEGAPGPNVPNLAEAELGGRGDK